VLLGINYIPMTNADIITGVSLMLLFVFVAELFGGTLGFGTLLISHITFDVPYVILSVMPCLYHLDRNLSEAAQDLGATPSQAFFRIIMPQLRPGVVNGLIIAFTMSIDDFVISYFTAGSSVSTLAMVIYSMTRKRISPEINAMSTILFVSVLVLLIIINAREIHQQNAEQKRLAALKRDAVHQ
jgi:spermidine/putrescine transport system permease protein